MRHALFTGALALLASFLLPSHLSAFGGEVPSGLPSGFMMGMVDDDFVTSCSEFGAGGGTEINSVANWMATVDPAHTGFQFAYRYLQGGFVSNSGGWYQQYPGNGGSIAAFASMVTGNGYLPVFIYYQLGQLSGGSSATGESVTNASDMGQYYQDWDAALYAINAWMSANPGKPVIIDVEPDMSGSVEQAGYSPTSYTMDVSSASTPGGVGTTSPYQQPTQANTFQGYCAYLLAMKDKYVTGTNNANLHLAFHVSGWATGSNNPAATAGLNSSDTAGLASTIGNFVNACQPASGSKFELFFTDPSGYDGGTPTYGASYDWTAMGTTAMGDQYAQWLNDLSGDVGMRCMLWQVPMGNSHMENTNGHYKDARPEYFLADSPLNDLGYSHNLCLYYNSGCVGILWGRGDYNCTGVMDYFAPPGQTWAPYTASSTSQDCGTYSGTASWVNPAVDDDDAGFFRSHIANNASWGASCAPAPSPTISATDTRTSTATPTPTPTDTRSATQTATPTKSPSPTATATHTPTVTAAVSSPTATGTGTPSFTVTSTATGSSTPTSTPTSSVPDTASPSATATGTASPTGSPTLTIAVGTGTATPTATGTATVAVDSPTTSPSATPTFTHAVDSPTTSPSATPTFTHAVDSPSASPSATPTWTRSAVSPTASPSATPSLTLAVDSQTPTASPSGTPSSTPTATPSFTPLGAAFSATATGTVTPLPTATRTASPSPSNTPAAVPTATATPTPTPSLTASPMAGTQPVITSVSPGSGSVSGGFLVTVTGTNFQPGAQIVYGGLTVSTAVLGSSGGITTLQATAPASTETSVVVNVVNPGMVFGPATPAYTILLKAPTPGAGWGEVTTVRPYPNPNPHALSIYVTGSCDRLEVSLYTKSMLEVDLYDGAGTQGPGWIQVPVPQDLKDGLYYCRVRSWTGSSASPYVLAKLFVLR